MQIREIILYGRNGKKRVLPLRPGEVNIITGQSHTGKSALIHIVSYCLGGGTCHVPTGRILDTVAWFGLLLEVGQELVFVARENPFPDRSSTANAVLLRAVGGSPSQAPSVADTSIDAFEDQLTRLLGISPNRHVPPQGSTRPPLSANIRHALFYCFQHQTEIAINQALFHRQQEQAADYLIQAVRDTLPYFLGAIQENELALEEQLTLARRQLRQLEAEQRQNEQIQGVGVTRARALVQEAASVGILSGQPLPGTMPELRVLMEEAMRWTPGQSVFAGSDMLGQLQDETNVLKEERSRLAEAIRAARAMSGETQGFADEAKIQAERLECIGLFDDIGSGHEACPTCAQHLTNPVPQAEAIRGALNQLSQSLKGAERERPNLQEYIEKTNRDLMQVAEKIGEKEAAINALLNEQEAAQRIRDLNSRRSKVVGRVSLYLESVPPEDGVDDLGRRIADAKRRVDRLAAQLDPQEKARRLASILNRLSLKMSEWARFLEMEFKDYPVLLDIPAATVMIDLPNRPEPLSRIGSGENWVGYHLIAHLALHRHFRQNKRPVPGFLFLDQPTQVYFPPERDPETEGDVNALNDDDQQKVSRMFELIFLAVKELNPDFQVIVTDHADLRSSSDFQGAIIERWRGIGHGLIPSDW
jgi:lipase chaperone LimK